MDLGRLTNEELIELKNKKKLDFERLSYSTFIAYGIKDVELLIQLDEKLKLIDLAKFLAYYCGVCMLDVQGTVKQWNSFMYNESFNKKKLLPVKNYFGSSPNLRFLNYAANEFNGERKKEYQRLLEDPELHGQKFIGGWVRGTAKFWKWVFSLDYTSLYPSAQMWANIGIDTLILPDDVHEELLELRAKYFIYYPKDVEAKLMEEYDYRFVREVLNNKEAIKEINEVLNRHNVSATPNGMFFRKDTRSAMSSIIENLITQRKKYKKLMKTTEQEIENLKKDNHSAEEIFKLEQIKDGYNTYQMAIKIFLNSNYGAQNGNSTLFAGHSEYFSAAITSVSRIANIFIGQEQSKNISGLAGSENIENRYGYKTYMDNIAQGDTDSCLPKTIIITNEEATTMEDFYNNTDGNIEIRGEDNFIKNIDGEYLTPSINMETGKLEIKKINYIMKHKVKKRMFKMTVGETSVTVTEDHSCIVNRKGNYISVKPKEIIKEDKIIKIV